LGGNVYAAALRQIVEDRAAGRRLILATASYRFYVEPIAQALGFDAVIATDSVRDSASQLYPKIAGENCYGAAKLRMIEAWFAAQGIARGDVHVRFYSDHVSDAPVLAWADQPFAVNAHPPLVRLARERSWPLLDWRG
jgi:HAD superfamily phosphoserine phosphatase-like hydrolase